MEIVNLNCDYHKDIPASRLTVENSYCSECYSSFGYGEDNILPRKYYRGGSGDWSKVLDGLRADNDNIRTFNIEAYHKLPVGFKQLSNPLKALKYVVGIGSPTYIPEGVEEAIYSNLTTSLIYSSTTRKRIPAEKEEDLLIDEISSINQGSVGHLVPSYVLGILKGKAPVEEDLTWRSLVTLMSSDPRNLLMLSGSFWEKTVEHNRLEVDLERYLYNSFEKFLKYWKSFSDHTRSNLEFEQHVEEKISLYFTKDYDTDADKIKEDYQLELSPCHDEGLSFMYNFIKDYDPSTFTHKYEYDSPSKPLEFVEKNRKRKMGRELYYSLGVLSDKLAEYAVTYKDGRWEKAEKFLINSSPKEETMKYFLRKTSGFSKDLFLSYLGSLTRQNYSLKYLSEHYEKTKKKIDISWFPKGSQVNKTYLKEILIMSKVGIITEVPEECIKLVAGNHPELSYYYASCILQGRFPEGEAIMMKEKLWRDSYLEFINFLKKE